MMEYLCYCGLVGSRFFCGAQRSGSVLPVFKPELDSNFIPGSSVQVDKMLLGAATDSN